MRNTIEKLGLVVTMEKDVPNKVVVPMRWLVWRKKKFLVVLVKNKMRNDPDESCWKRYPFVKIIVEGIKQFFLLSFYRRFMKESTLLIRGNEFRVDNRFRLSFSKNIWKERECTIFK